MASMTIWMLILAVWVVGGIWFALNVKNAPMLDEYELNFNEREERE